MNILLDEYKEILALLLKHKVNFMLIGGYAVVHYGYERNTGDMDIWLQLGNENRDKLVMALEEYDIDEEGIEHLKQMNFENPVPAFIIGDKPRTIDFITLISNLKFEDAIKEVYYYSMYNLNIPIIHYNHLILSKLTTGRMKDKADVEELNRINQHRKG